MCFGVGIESFVYRAPYPARDFLFAQRHADDRFDHTKGIFNPVVKLCDENLLLFGQLVFPVNVDQGDNGAQKAPRFVTNWLSNDAHPELAVVPSLIKHVQL